MNNNEEQIKKIKQYTLGEEIFNSVSHGLAAGLSIAGCTLLIVKAVFSGSVLSVVCSAIFGATLIILYTMSTLYHAITNKTAKKVFRIFDHCSIFLLIAGTYTPFTLITLGGTAGIITFCVLWGLTIIGITLNSVRLEKFKKFSMALYILMGWSVIFTLKGFIENLSFPGLILLSAGGLCYTVGITFYINKKVKYMHSIWHLFVTAGSILHYLSIFFYVI